ncbi:MAG TPA: sensor histidine kinase [Solirubrobacteraceae bacterium]
MSFVAASLSRARPKIVCRREAQRPDGDENALVHALDHHRLLAVTRDPRASEIALMTAFALAAAYDASTSSSGPYPGRNIAIVLGVLLFALIAARRWTPVAAGAATLATTAAITGTQGATLTAVSSLVVLFLLARLVIRRSLLFTTPLVVPFIVLAVARDTSHHAVLASTAPLLFLAAALAVGESLRRRELAIAALGASEEAMADSTRARTVLEERARIARELHDIVAHHLSVITIESEAARLTSPKLSADARRRFEAIASTAREALNETRHLLGVLREDNVGEAERTPQPGLDELDNLIETAKATGTSIRLVREGTITQLPLSVDLAAYRIVQEALTNARRHAPGAHVDVEVSYGEQALQLRVKDNGPAATNGAPVEGHGLLGMRERAMLAGGTFSSGLAKGGGFEVLATLPTAETSP